MKAIPITQIQGGEILAKDIYMENGAILMSQGSVIRPGNVDRLRAAGYSMVYIVEEEIANLIDRATEQKIQKHCQDSVRAVIDKFSYGVDAGLDSISHDAENIIKEVLTHPKVLYNVSQVRDKSNSIYLHCINVSALSVFIGLKMKLSEERIKHMAIGALLHDIGMIYLPAGIQVENADNCGETILRELKKHVILGYSSVEKEDWLSQTAKDIIVNHHERIDGSGFPFRLSGSKLPLETKIVSVCDEFDSMVYGVNRNKWKIKEAVDQILGYADIKFDFRVVQTFVASVAVYPIGTIVKLNTGERALVIEQNNNLPTRPILSLIEETKTGMTPTERIIDLTEELTIVITDTIEI